MKLLLGLRVTNWRTTVAGCMAAIIAVADGIAKLVDADPSTNPDWGLIMAAVVVAIGLIRARDDVVTSTEMKQAGVLP